MPYCQLYYHLVWRTRAREPLIVQRIEAQVHGLLRKKAVGLGATVYAVNGMEDHVHVVASVPPAVALADFVGKVKGYCSYEANKAKLADSHFRWQQEYGAFSFDRKRLPYVIAYVENQKRHHAEKTTIRILERADGGPASEIREPATPYDLDDTRWRRELQALDADAPGDDAPR